MIDKISTINDLASVDFGFAELYNERGINPFPFVCDGFDLSFLEEDDSKILGEKFLCAKTKLDELIEKLDGERTTENVNEIDKLIENLKGRSDLIGKNSEEFKKPDFSFPDLYISLKQMQNTLGISIPFPELNVINFMGEDVDVEVLKEKMLDYVQKMKKFMFQSEQAFYRYNKTIENEKTETMNKSAQNVQDVKITKKETKNQETHDDNKTIETHKTKESLLQQ